MKKLDLSIIVVNWNTKKLTVDCVKSIISSKPGVSYEIIMVDNASADGSVGALRELERKKVRLIENKNNLGFARGVNLGARGARGKYLFLLNSDTKMARNYIDELIHFAKNASEAGVVGTKLLNIDRSIQPSCYRLPTLWRSIRQYWLGEEKILDKYVPSGEDPVEVESVVGASFLITPEARSKVGLLDERYFMYFEDLDYCRSVRKAGLKVYYLPNVEVVHYHGASGNKAAGNKDQLERLTRSSMIYHGIIRHYLIWFVMWSGQKLRLVI
ncbi:MAG: glycosyltransferase [Candidatus Woesebacteria bacterium GW2011_GWB1_43_14]|uniref:Glycosyltransferase n=1 Tax=Candidatus Woesebacteria bacterium GW2011_GWB1_43_14 TaxID=1618578 RepID=A0A0G1DHT6_9BACT|nr:MAG: glycosyltransferase [Candidatus Woesebacteria bacterium GW2011_GWA1_39_11b]KKS78328.1 MAG: glycosyltransferase [Candidatus Woesebacteria bacterium GW2011_GWC1_42_9]KKS97254.1 MAG: glycosyltransferase [Candidatus Woesebacteria bacterium GW2011_GWB1_43_14]